MRSSFRHMTHKVFLLSLFTFHLSPSLAQHYVGPALSGGLVQTLDDLRQTQSRLSGGGELGVAYQYQHGHLLLHMGLNYTLQCPVQSVDSQWLNKSMIDTRGVAVTYRGLLDNRSDQLFLHQLSIPFMVGGSWSGFYLLAGLKFSVALAAQARETAALRTAGDYNGRYYEWFEDMPNHGYHDFEPVRSSQNLMLNRFDLRLAAELGYTFRLNIQPTHYNPRLNPHSAFAPAPLLRLGLFAEYGMINMLSSAAASSGLSSAAASSGLSSAAASSGLSSAAAFSGLPPRTTADWSQYLSVSLTHIYASDEAAKARANMFFFGVRLTLLFPVATSPDQYKCRCTGIWQ